MSKTISAAIKRSLVKPRADILNLLIDTTGKSTYTTPVTVGYTYLTVFDAKSGTNLWSDSKKWGNLYTGFHSATKGLIDELKKRMDEQASQQAAKDGKKN